MARIGVGKRVGNGFIWTSSRVGGVLGGCLVAILALIGLIGMIALFIGIVSR